jgi:hypothetical protein
MDFSSLPVFGVFAFLSAVAFIKLQKSYVIATSFLVGWLLLPSYVFQLSTMPKEGVFPIWILGSSVPSLDWFSKAWFIPTSLLAIAAIFDREAFAKLRGHWLDALMLLWCLWPTLQSWFLLASEPNCFIQTGYLLGSWASPWLLGRLYFSQAADHLRLIKILCLTAWLYLPVSIFEGIWGPELHEFIYGAHAFRHIGIQRYIGFRPIGFLEDGNQFGIWIGMTAVAGVWLARLAVGPRAPFYRWQAIVICTMALAAQSVGAIGLALLGIAMLFFWEHLNPKMTISAITLLTILVMVAYIVSAGSVNWLWHSPLGNSVVEMFKDAGRGSLPWRIWADQAALATVRESIFLGTGNWAWWRPANIRPWGLPQLLVGQFGLIGVALCSICVAFGAIAQMFRSEGLLALQPKGGGLILSFIVLLSLFDALLNSFVFFPLFLIAGALAGSAASSLTSIKSSFLRLSSAIKQITSNR